MNLTMAALILSLVALVVTKAMDVVTTIRHVDPDDECNPLARTLFSRWGFRPGLVIVCVVWTAITATTYVMAFESDSGILRMATAIIGFLISWAQWDVARFNATRRPSWFTGIAMAAFRRGR